MRFTKIIFDGSVDELRAIYPLLLDDDEKNCSIEKSSQSPSAEINTENSRGLTTAVAEIFLTRRPLAKNQKEVLKAVLAASDAGVTSSALSETIGCDIDMIKGAMRSFGKRAAHTEGWPSGLKSFDSNWTGTEVCYRLHQAVRDVLTSNRVEL